MLNSIEEFKVPILLLNRAWNHCSVLIRQLTEAQILHGSKTVAEILNSVYMYM